ncbi:helix-turn-helix transcriptional regulator [Sneathiella sp. CAU 1612]|uniref:Helix-turn-helix transcriptional regulator n=1 Tax=Sneathiella sedimenti TaxID=2816034 RepID=A0ABS3F514_9PROT|nr:helix-turn-helix domain-containing protein [Sneathiella sedimenti]MBO0333618.1 helix-turn-helix transcriptional regulator [Sneathiella sedimenti]
MAPKHESNQCPMESILGQIMGPWTPYILWLLSNEESLRFGQLSALIPDISAKVLTDRLRKLEASGLVHRDYQPTVPPTVYYSLTDRGAELHEVLQGLNEVALRWDAEDRKKRLIPVTEIIAAE